MMATISNIVDEIMGHHWVPLIALGLAGLILVILSAIIHTKVVKHY